MKRNTAIYRCVAGHERTPWMAKALLGLALAYALTPIDIIPDWLPVIGHLDDVLVVPGLVAPALKIVPGDVVEGPAFEPGVTDKNVGSMKNVA